MLATTIPMTPLPPRPRLRVVENGAQDCSTCRNMTSCWKSGLDEQAVALNILVCRIQRGIQRDKATRLFLHLIRPKLLKIAKWVRSRTGMDVHDAVREMESVAIETLLTTYVMGELVPPIVYLFNERHGAVRHWAVRTVSEARRQRAMYLSYGGTAAGERATEGGGDLEARLISLNRVATQSRIHTAPPGLVEEGEDAGRDERIEALCQRALSVVEDGVTLPVTEYRILKFFLVNARDGVRMTEWITPHMARILGIPPNNVSRLYGLAYRRVIEKIGHKKTYLKARGLVPNVVRTADGSSKRLTADEIIEALRLLEEGRGHGATVMDVAWALGATDITIHNVKRRYAGKTPEEIRAMCKG